MGTHVVSARRLRPKLGAGLRKRHSPTQEARHENPCLAPVHERVLSGEGEETFTKGRPRQGRGTGNAASGQKTSPGLPNIRALVGLQGVPVDYSVLCPSPVWSKFSSVPGAAPDVVGDMRVLSGEETFTRARPRQGRYLKEDCFPTYHD